MARTGDALPDPALITLATRLQASFRHRGLSLADPDTAEAFLVSLEALRPILDGALHTGLLSQQQHETLDGMFAAAALTTEVL